MYDTHLHTHKYSLGKTERLKKQTTLDQLFKEGKSISIDGFTLVYLIATVSIGIYPVQAAFSAPKRYLPLSPHRSRAKRLMREAYRLHKLKLYELLASQNIQLSMMIICRIQTVPTHDAVTKAIPILLDKLCTKLKRDKPPLDK
jgi:ribonuclease P protein component